MTLSDLWPRFHDIFEVEYRKKKDKKKKTKLPYYCTIPNIWNGATFGDLDSRSPNVAPFHMLGIVLLTYKRVTQICQISWASGIISISIAITIRSTSYIVVDYN